LARALSIELIELSLFEFGRASAFMGIESTFFRNSFAVAAQPRVKA